MRFKSVSQLGTEASLLVIWLVAIATPSALCLQLSTFINRVPISIETGFCEQGSSLHGNAAKFIITAGKDFSSPLCCGGSRIWSIHCQSRRPNGQRYRILQIFKICIPGCFKKTVPKNQFNIQILTSEIILEWTTETSKRKEPSSWPI